VYEEWRHDAEAETMYRQALATDSNNKACYYKLWQILETQAKYNEAENILLLFAQKFSNGFDMLNKFYERVTTALPDNADWFAKAGNFHYNEVISHPQKYNLVNYEPDKDVYQYFDDHELLHYDGQESEFIIGTKEIMDFKVNLKNQKTMTIYYFGIADSLLQYANITEVTKNSLADINVKMGSMYDVLQNSDRAIYCFTKAIALQKNNTASRAKLIQVLDKYYLYTLAQLHLDTLAKTQQINFKQLVLQYKYQVLSQKQLEAKATLQKILNVDPAYKTTIENLQKLNEYLGKNYSQAITMYQAQIASNTTDANAMYTIARMYYLQNKTSDAYLWHIYLYLLCVLHC
jgi:predicted Zn-dependent protease